MLERGAGRERRPPGRALYGNTETGGEVSEEGVSVHLRFSYPAAATENRRTRSELPHWHYFVCNLLIFKGVGFKTGLCS